MRPVLFAPTILAPAILVLGLTACDGTADTATSPSTVNEMAAASAPPSATRATVAGSEAAPVELPDYVPVIPGGTVVMAERKGDVLTANIKAPGSIPDAVKFYEQTLKNNDMNPVKMDGSNGAAQLISREKGRYLTVNIGPGPTGDASIGIVDKPAG